MIIITLKMITIIIIIIINPYMKSKVMLSTQIFISVDIVYLHNYVYTQT